MEANPEESTVGGSCSTCGSGPYKEPCSLSCPSCGCSESSLARLWDERRAFRQRAAALEARLRGAQKAGQLAVRRNASRQERSQVALARKNRELVVELRSRLVPAIHAKRVRLQVGPHSLNLWAASPLLPCSQ